MWSPSSRLERYIRGVRPLAAMNLVGLAALWVAAVAVAPSLPERLPVHFDLSGRPDAWSSSRAWWWFLPALATVLVVLLAFLVPPWTEKLARANSRWLNVPDAARFRALPEAARVRAIGPLRTGMEVLGLELQLLLAIVMAAVAGGDREVPLDPLWMAAAIVLLLATIVWMTVRGLRAVRAETRGDSAPDAS